jgi:putative exporter of polyketide antibiotics
VDAEWFRLLIVAILGFVLQRVSTFLDHLRDLEKEIIKIKAELGIE